MATNPRFPDPSGNRPGPTPVRPNPPSSGRTGVILAIVAALILLGVILYYMPRAPKATAPPAAADVPQQPTGAQIQVQHLQMSAAPVGTSMVLQGEMMNNSSQTVNGVAMNVTFMDNSGRRLGSEQVPVQILQTEKGKGNRPADVKDQRDLTSQPLQPNSTALFRAEINNVPANWNHQMPEITVTQVTAHQ